MKSKLSSHMYDTENINDSLLRRKVDCTSCDVVDLKTLKSLCEPRKQPGRQQEQVTRSSGSISGNLCKMTLYKTLPGESKIHIAHTSKGTMN